MRRQLFLRNKTKNMQTKINNVYLKYMVVAEPFMTSEISTRFRREHATSSPPRILGTGDLTNQHARYILRDH